MNIVDRYQNTQAREMKIDTSSVNGWGTFVLSNINTGEVLMNGQLRTENDFPNRVDLRDRELGVSLNALTVDASQLQRATISARQYPQEMSINRPFRIRFGDGTIFESQSAQIEFLD